MMLDQVPKTTEMPRQIFHHIEILQNLPAILENFSQHTPCKRLKILPPRLFSLLIEAGHDQCNTRRNDRLQGTHKRTEDHDASPIVNGRIHQSHNGPGKRAAGHIFGGRKPRRQIRRREHARNVLDSCSRDQPVIGASGETLPTPMETILPTQLYCCPTRWLSDRNPYKAAVEISTLSTAPRVAKKRHLRRLSVPQRAWSTARHIPWGSSIGQACAAAFSPVPASAAGNSPLELPTGTLLPGRQPCCQSGR